MIPKTLTAALNKWQRAMAAHRRELKTGKAVFSERRNQLAEVRILAFEAVLKELQRMNRV